jgi:hypothetical protein
MGVGGGLRTAFASAAPRKFAVVEQSYRRCRNADETVKDLRSFGDEKRQTPFRIEEADLEGRGARSLARQSSRGLNGCEVGRRRREVDFGWRGAAEAFVGP